MAAEVAEFLWNKSLNALREAETELFFQFTLASNFQGIKQVMESQNKENICSSLASDICELLYELNDVLTECRIFAQQRKASKKNWLSYKTYTVPFFLRRRKSRLVEVKDKLLEKIENWEGKISECNDPKIPGLNEYIPKIENVLFKDGYAGYKAVRICGMGGTGKTTLAREFFDSEKASTMYSKKIWLCLSDIQRNERETVKIQIHDLVLKELANEHELSIDDSQDPLEALQRRLQKGSYLVVFDDVWPWHAEILHKQFSMAGDSAAIITSRLPEVARRMECRNLILLQPPLYHGKTCERIWTSGICDRSSIHGFQPHVLDIESRLCEGGFKIIGISGMGGSGKTALAREVFNGESVSKAFSTKVWVCLSAIQSNETNIGIQIFKLVLNELDYDIDELIIDRLNMVELSETLHHLISGEKYLIVFDDVWPWHASFLAAEMKSAGGLPRGGGGAVVVTSRLQKVVRRIGGENLISFQPPLLQGEDCRKIFYDTLGSIATSNALDKEPWNKIKHEVVYKSHGLPLAAKTLGEIFLDKIRRNSEISSEIS